MGERLYWLGFALFSGIGPKRFSLLLEAFGSAREAWIADEKLIAASGIGEKIASQFCDFRQKTRLEPYEEALQTKRISYVTSFEPSYPPLLKQIDKPPYVLFFAGSLVALEGDTIAIVGTRAITHYGETVTKQITSELVHAGYTIVSGLAFGVDAVAHRTTLSTKGKTIAVLGCGIDCCSPREHQHLYEEIIDSGGAIVSEFSLGVTPTKGSFPSRNRIIAGLSQAVIVTEGAADSGALYTARDAFLAGRPVFAVPGPITSSLSQGPHALLTEGATLVTSSSAILKALGNEKKIHGTKKIAVGDTEEEQRIIDVLRNEDLHVDEIIRQTSYDAVKVAGLISLMELKGVVSHTSEGLIALRN